jgi:hypothetical protein
MGAKAAWSVAARKISQAGSRAFANSQADRQPDNQCRVGDLSMVSKLGQQPKQHTPQRDNHETESAS